jgi:hypothetical protein
MNIKPSKVDKFSRDGGIVDERLMISDFDSNFDDFLRNYDRLGYRSEEGFFVIAKGKEKRLSIDCVYIADVERFNYETNDLFYIKKYQNIPRMKQNFYTTSEFLLEEGRNVEYIPYLESRYRNRRDKSGSVFVREIRVYNVGHGNLNYIKLSDDREILFDFGSHTNYQNKIERDSLSVSEDFEGITLENITELYISHQHRDHFKSAIDKITSVNDIVYENPQSTGNFSVYHQAKICGNLDVYSTDNGSGTNNKALLLGIRESDKLFFLTGDVKSGYVNSLYKKYNLDRKVSIVVPHHTGNFSAVNFIFDGDLAIHSYELDRYKSIPKKRSEDIITANFKKELHTKDIVMHHYHKLL